MNSSALEHHAGSPRSGKSGNEFHENLKALKIFAVAEWSITVVRNKASWMAIAQVI